MTDYTAQIKSKGLDATGVTEEVVRDLYNKLGSRMMFIGEARVDARSDGTDGTHKVQLSLTQVEPATDSTLSEHLRELTRTLYFNRQSADQPTLDAEGVEPKFEDVLAAGAKHRPHPYLSSHLAIDDSDTGPVCDVCGLTETAGVHRDQAGVPDPFDAAADDATDPDADPVLDEADEPHEFTDAGDGSCRLCERDEDAAVHILDEDHTEEDDATTGEDEPADDGATVLTFSGAKR